MSGVTMKQPRPCVARAHFAKQRQHLRNALIMRQAAAVNEHAVGIVIAEFASHALAEDRIEVEHLLLGAAGDDLVRFLTEQRRAQRRQWMGHEQRRAAIARGKLALAQENAPAHGFEPPRQRRILRPLIEFRDRIAATIPDHRQPKPADHRTHRCGNVVVARMHEIEVPCAGQEQPTKYRPVDELRSRHSRAHGAEHPHRAVRQTFGFALSRKRTLVERLQPAERPHFEMRAERRLRRASMQKHLGIDDGRRQALEKDEQNAFADVRGRRRCVG